MNEEIGRPEHTMNAASTTGSEGTSDDVAADGQVYEEPHISYIPLPEVEPVQPRSSSKEDSASSSFSPQADSVYTKGGVRGRVALFGMALGALLGGVLGFFVAGNPFLGGIIGAIAGGMIPYLPELLVGSSWALLEGVGEGLGEISNCCPFSILLILVGGVTMSGLLFWVIRL